jgi:hypothetical protein
MPIELGLWRIDEGLVRLTSSSLDREAKLEQALFSDVTMLGSDLMLVGRQVPTAYGKRVDLLAIAADGELQVIELKRDRTPRDAVAQLLDYGSWVQGLSHSDITHICSGLSPSVPFEQAFEQRFGVPPPETLNESHQLILVASELDPSSERIVDYIARFGVPINVVLFRYFRDGDREYLGRTWLIEPALAEVLKAPSQHGSEAWNGRDFTVTLGEDQHRSWEDCRRYGFVSGGQGLWYSKTLAQLVPGARVFAMIPGRGYVGVGIVTEGAVPVKSFTVDNDGATVPILEAPHTAPRMGENADDPERSEYLVRVDWIRTVPASEAFWEKGMRANQNTAYKLRSKFTLDRLVGHFGLEE